MKIAPLLNRHKVLVKTMAFLFVTFAAYPIYSLDLNCENDFEKPTIQFPDLPNVVSGDTLFFPCAENILGIAQARAIVNDNCDPNPFVRFGEFCQDTKDCSKGYKYLVECIWTVIDNNNNVTEFIIFVAIEDETPPRVILNWGDNILSGDTLYMECGFAEPFDESYVSVTDDCNLSVFCKIESPIRNLVFEELVVAEGNCDEYITEMSCTWTATDRCGNSSVFEIVVFITDSTPPEFINIPETYCGSNSLTEEQFQEYRKGLSDIEVEDICTDVEVKYTIGGRSDGCSYRIQWEASDACGNTSYYEQLVCIDNVRCVGQISGTVKVDSNKDRVGDDPVAQVTLFLIEDVDGDGKVDGGETVYLTTTTDVNGFYRFIDVPQGCYVIVELQPNGLVDTRDEDVTNPGDSDKDGTNDPTDNLIPVCISPGEFDDGNDFVEEQFVLAIELSSFTATYNPKEELVNIDWETTHELNSSHFLLEKSSNGVDFFELGNVLASNNNSNGGSYEFVDADINSSDIYYYRLVDVDMDGVLNKSNVISIHTQNNVSFFKVFPNPSAGLFNVVLHSDLRSEVISLELFNMAGQRTYKQSMEGGEFQLDFSDMHSGTYMIRLHTSTKTYIKKIFIYK